jgi:hypothetical protein
VYIPALDHCRVKLTTPHRLLSSNRTDLAEVFIACPFYERCVLLDRAREFAQRLCIKTMTAVQLHHRV